MPSATGSATGQHRRCEIFVAHETKFSKASFRSGISRRRSRRRKEAQFKFPAETKTGNKVRASSPRLLPTRHAAPFLAAARRQVEENACAGRSVVMLLGLGEELYFPQNFALLRLESTIGSLRLYPHDAYIERRYLEVLSSIRWSM
jgi:hypothetical protein